jgi:hypothetical protein
MPVLPVQAACTDAGTTLPASNRYCAGTGRLYGHSTSTTCPGKQPMSACRRLFWAFKSVILQDTATRGPIEAAPSVGMVPNRYLTILEVLDIVHDYGGLYMKASCLATCPPIA